MNDYAAERSDNDKREKSSWRKKTGHTHLAAGC